jgi:tRNA threonylcarbamoyl adenosine modification protein (Sua5/YciO/YrdC/YwlC family)
VREERVDEVVAALEAGGVVVLPTDTVYGLAARASDARAISRLFALKQRTQDVPLAVLCASVEQALELTDPVVRVAVAAVAARWWPGPLTLVVPRQTGVDLHLGEPLHTIGLRVPDHELLRSVAARVGPLAATSANRHGEPVADTAAAAAEALGDGVALVIDGGTLGIRSSTVVDLADEPWSVRRSGPIDGEAVIAVARATGRSGG